MSKKNEKQYKKNRNKVRMPKVPVGQRASFSVEVQSCPALYMNQFIDANSIEMYQDYSIGASRGALKDNWTCYYIDLQYANPYYVNDWVLQHAFARRFVDRGMRVFLEHDGVLVAGQLNAEAFDIMFQGLLQPLLDEHGFCEKAAQLSEKTRCR